MNRVSPWATLYCLPPVTMIACIVFNSFITGSLLQAGLSLLTACLDAASVSYQRDRQKGYRKRQGHRQPYTKVEIGAIKA